MTDAHALTDPWFIDDEPEVQADVQREPFVRESFEHEPVELTSEVPSLRPKLAPAMLFIALVVVTPLVYAAMAMI